MKDIKAYSRNNEVRVQEVVVATISYKQPKSETLVSAETYACGTIPAGALVKSVDIVVTEAFDGTTPTADIGITGSTVLYANDLDLSSTGVTAGAGGDGVYYSENTDILVTPTLSSATKGKFQVVLSVIMPDTRSGSFTA